MAGSSSHTPRRSGPKRRRTFRPNTDINITPLVDVMLVLVVIFMVTAPMMTVGVPVDLPKTQAAQMNDQVEPLVVSVDAQGHIFLQETEMPVEVLITRLQAITGNNPDARVYIRGDKKLAYGQIMEIMGSISSAGFSKVSLIAEMPTPAPTNKMTKNPLPVGTKPLAASRPSQLPPKA
ncbi:protein TolR [Candidatus Finniella inopinata]|uniref:Protein TolR n=1 Tax=Candidatus Finniella inopinata TaxID=1696036 RepID=A0A4Q7DLK7_9PROT|nr:protein TolR [Candidatus Finniella inopinata]RZI47145.1 protein TolR [Candidatus Finniella inopinata]